MILFVILLFSAFGLYYFFKGFWGLKNKKITIGPYQTYKRDDIKLTNIKDVRYWSIGFMGIGVFIGLMMTFSIVIVIINIFF